MRESAGSASSQALKPRRLANLIRKRWWLVIPLLFFVTVMAVAGVGGYIVGTETRERNRIAQSQADLQEQFDLGVQDLLGGRYELARQRFEYILNINPDYPGAVELLSRSLEALNQPTITATFAPTPTSDLKPSPTVSSETLEGRLQNAKSELESGNIDTAIEHLVTLIALDPSFHRQEVDDLLYTALRTRGLDKIWSGRQEPGIYDLTLAEQIAPLDNQAASWKRSAAFYLFANSYFGLDWALSTQYFSQICQAGIWDGCFKYARSAWGYADQLFLEDEDPCAAVVQYDAALLTMPNVGPPPTATKVAEACLTATAEPPTSTVTATGSPEVTTLTPTLTTSPAAQTATATSTQVPAGATNTATVSPTPTVSPTSSATPSPSPTP